MTLSDYLVQKVRRTGPRQEVEEISLGEVNMAKLCSKIKEREVKVKGIDQRKEVQHYSVPHFFINSSMCKCVEKPLMLWRKWTNTRSVKVVELLVVCKELKVGNKEESMTEFDVRGRKHNRQFKICWALIMKDNNTIYKYSKFRLGR